MELNFASMVEVPLDWHWWPHQFPGRVQVGRGWMGSLNDGSPALCASPTVQLPQQQL